MEPYRVRLLNQQKPVEEPSRVTSRDNLDIRLLREGLGGPIMAKGHARSAITGRYISRAAAARHPGTSVVESGGNKRAGTAYRSPTSGRCVTKGTARRSPNSTVTENG